MIRARKKTFSSRHARRGRIGRRLDELEPHRDGEIVLYCESGRRAGKAGDVLTGAGFEGIHHLEGDMSGWRKAGRPTEH